MVRMLVRSGAKVNAQNAQGHSPLHYAADAAGKGAVACFEVLLRGTLFPPIHCESRINEYTDDINEASFEMTLITENSHLFLLSVEVEPNLRWHRIESMFV